MLVVAGAFAILGLVLAATGIHGIVAYVARRRLRESALRLALGAHPRGELARALSEGMVPATLGLGVGLGVTLLAFQLTSSVILGIEGPSSTGLLMAGCLIATTGMLAA